MLPDVYIYSDIGGRDVNEDYGGGFMGDNCGSIIVCDGLGGEGDGDIASKLVSEYIINEFKNEFPSRMEDIEKCLIRANDKLIARQNEIGSRMMTTVVGCVFENDKLTYFNIGDSRFYLFRNGKLKRQSYDHSAARLAVDLKEITEDDIRTYKKRNMLFKAIGSDTILDAKQNYISIDIKEGDAFLICTDGFWEYVTESDMEATLEQTKTAEEWFTAMRDILLNHTDENNDNYTAACGRFIKS